MTQQQTSLSISIAPRSGLNKIPNRNIFMEQTGLPPESINLQDIYKMWTAALAGQAAESLRGECPMTFADGIATVWFDFFVYPVPADLDFTLETSTGELQPPEIIEKPKSHDVIFTMSDSVDLEYSPLSASVGWETACYLQNGDRLESQEITIDSNSLLVSQPCFAVARVNSIAHALKYRLIVEIEKVTEDGEQRITLEEPKITAKWTNAEGKPEGKELSLRVQKCVSYGLNLCDGDLGLTICSPQHIKVFYSTCDGSFLGTRRDDSTKWCGKKGGLGYAS